MSTIAEGILTVKVVSGALFIKKFLKAKPFIQIRFANQTRTTPRKKGRYPQWGNSFIFQRFNEGFIIFRLFNKGYIKKSMKGRGIVPLKACIQTGFDKLQCFAFRNSKKVALVEFQLNFQLYQQQRFINGPSDYIAFPFSKTNHQNSYSAKRPIRRKQSSQKNKPLSRLQQEKTLDRVTYGLNIEDISWGRCIYKSQNQQQAAFIAFIPPNDTETVTKITYCTSPDQFNIVQKQAQTISQLSHPNICKIYGSLLDISKQKFISILVLEKCQGQDLSKEINQRFKIRRFWHEQELWELFSCLVDAFAYIQENGIVHSDIKPGNIILTDSFPKVIDFGISLLAPLEFFAYTATFQVGGSVPFFSPIQMRAYLDFVKGANPKGSVHHNPFKSDVFSLGLTFYTCAKLFLDKGMNDPRNPNLQQFVYDSIDGIQYSERMKEFIKSLLQVDEISRPNFQEVWARWFSD